MLTYCRLSEGCQDFVLYKELEKHFTCVNFDDEKYIYPQWEIDNVTYLARRLLRSRAIKILNQAIIRTASSVNDYDLFAFKGGCIQPKTVEYLKAKGGKVVYYLPDLSLNSPNNNLEFALKSADIIYTTKVDFAGNFPEYSGRLKFCEPIIDSRIFDTTYETKVNRRVVGFVGHYSKRKFTFVKYLIERLASSRIELEIIGSGWDSLQNMPEVKVYGPVYGRNAYAIAHTWGCTLGLLMEAHKGAPTEDQITTRSFEEPAYGLAVAHQYNGTYKSYFPMACTFESPSDMVKTIENIVDMSEKDYFEYRSLLRKHARKISNTSIRLAGQIYRDFES